MNQQETASSAAPSAHAPSGDITGLARVENIGTGPNVRATGGRSSASSGEGLLRNTLMGDTVGGGLGVVARVLNPTLVESVLSWAKRGGHYAVLGGGALTLVYAIYAAIRQNAFSVFMLGLGLVVALAVAQYVAMRFLDAADNLIDATPSRVSSTAFLECAGLIVLLMAAGVLLSGVTGAIALGSLLPLVPALLGAVALTCFGAMALHSRMANVSAGSGTAGEEAIGLLAFFFKAGLKLAPLGFALFAIVGALAVLMSFFGTGGFVAASAQNILSSLPVSVPVPAGLAGSTLLVVACLVPIAAYFVFLLQYLMVDLARAVLSLPGKIDGLKK
jgi:hypothetical protein